MQPECLTVSNDSRHADIVLRVRAAIEELQFEGKRVSFYAVADRGQVSRSTLYRADDLRKLVEDARLEATKPSCVRTADCGSRIAELERQLALALAERDELKRVVRTATITRYASTRLPGAA